MSMTRHVPTVIDLAAERTQRQQLAQQAAEGADRLVSGLQRAGQSLANLAWVVAAPVRHHDKEFREGIYELALARLNRIITGAMDTIDDVPEIRRTAVQHATSVAFAAFQAQLLLLAAAEQSGNLAS